MYKKLTSQRYTQTKSEGLEEDELERNETNYIQITKFQSKMQRRTRTLYMDKRYNLVIRYTKIQDTNTVRSKGQSRLLCSIDVELHSLDITAQII